MPIIGYAFSVVNEALDVNSYGSPKEVIDELGAKSKKFLAVFNNPETEIDATETLQEAPKLSFSGGRHAEAVLELLDAIQHSDVPSAATVLKQNPALFLSRHALSAVPLLAAAADGTVEMVSLFLRAGADVDAAGHFDMTALHWSAAKGLLETTTLLLDAGANAQALSWFFVTPLELATINNHEAVANVIADRQGIEGFEFTLGLIIDRMKQTAM
jgi:hypothetical protein